MTSDQFEAIVADGGGMDSLDSILAHDERIYFGNRPTLAPPKGNLTYTIVTISGLKLIKINCQRSTAQGPQIKATRYIDPTVITEVIMYVSNY